jgi:hypothetical protein
LQNKFPRSGANGSMFVASIAKNCSREVKVIYHSVC